MQQLDYAVNAKVGRQFGSGVWIVRHEAELGTLPRRVIEVLDHCKVIVRAGVGFDAVDLAAAGEKGGGHGRRNTQEDRHSCLSRDDVFADRQECLSSAAGRRIGIPACPGTTFSPTDKNVWPPQRVGG